LEALPRAIKEALKLYGASILDLDPNNSEDVKFFMGKVNHKDGGLNYSTIQLFNYSLNLTLIELGLHSKGLSSYMELLVLPQIKEFPTHLRSNSQSLVSCFRSAQGFSGTPGWNCETYSEKLETRLDAGVETRLNPTILKNTF